MAKKQPASKIAPSHSDMFEARPGEHPGQFILRRLTKDAKLVSEETFTGLDALQEHVEKLRREQLGMK